jgi:hypothetical protein
LNTSSPIPRVFKKSRYLIAVCILFLFYYNTSAQQFSVVAFFTAKQDLAHISFVHEANRWFKEQSAKFNFKYDSTNDWSLLNIPFLKKYDVVIFLDTRPDSPEQRTAFEEYMKQGGRWMGFHFAGFALTPSAYPQNWNWYHDTFLGAGEYKSNTWRPTTAVLKVEAKKHPATKNLPPIIKSAPNEWYCWKNDLRKNPDISILLSIDSSSFPLGTGPKPHEIWRSGYYPVVWTNTKYKMIYFNMGHNDMDYEHGTNRQLSSSFSEVDQNKLIIDALLWLGTAKKSKKRLKGR